MFRHVCHPDADGAQTDNTELFTPNLRTGKILLRLLRVLAYVLVRLVLLHPLDAAHNIAGCKEHTRNHKLLHAVCVGAGGVEHHDAFLCAFVEGNVVHASARARNCQQVFRQLHVVHCRTSHQNAVRLLYVLRLCVPVAELLQTHLCDGI